MSFTKNLNKLFCFLSPIMYFSQGNLAFCMEQSSSFDQGVFINWNTLNSEDMIYVKNPEMPSYTVLVTVSFAFDKAKELLKSGISEQTRIGTEIMVNLFTKRYPPVVELFDSICDEQDSSQLHRGIDTLERLLIEHFSDKKTRLGGWEEEDE